MPPAWRLDENNDSSTWQRNGGRIIDSTQNFHVAEKWRETSASPPTNNNNSNQQPASANAAARRCMHAIPCYYDIEILIAIQYYLLRLHLSIVTSIEGRGAVSLTSSIALRPITIILSTLALSPAQQHTSRDISRIYSHKTTT